MSQRSAQGSTPPLPADAVPARRCRAFSKTEMAVPVSLGMPCALLLACAPALRVPQYSSKSPFPGPPTKFPKPPRTGPYSCSSRPFSGLTPMWLTVTSIFGKEGEEGRHQQRPPQQHTEVCSGTRVWLWEDSWPMCSGHRTPTLRKREFKSAQARHESTETCA